MRFNNISFHTGGNRDALELLLLVENSLRVLSLYAAVICGTRAHLSSPDEGSCYVFSIRNNCCQFLHSIVLLPKVLFNQFSYLYIKTTPLNMFNSTIFLSLQIF